MRAPMDGVVLTRNLEVGEMAAPGGLVMTIGHLQEVELVRFPKPNTARSNRR